MAKQEFDIPNRASAPSSARAAGDDPFPIIDIGASAGGLTLAQDPAAAAFCAIPRSAINASAVDIVATTTYQPPSAIPATLERGPLVTRADLDAADDHLQRGMEQALMLLHAHSGHDFSSYKKHALYRRIERRMGIHQIDRITSYVRFLSENPQELELLFREFLIGVTSFFRDPAAWECLREVALTPLLEHPPTGRMLRAWVPGCSTGEEAYSLAISFKEAMERQKPARYIPLQIFATDLDGDAIERARQGRYPASIASDVSIDRLARFFIATDNGYQIGKEIREMVVFVPQNVAQDPPFTKLDLLLCRNLLIYFGAELKTKLLPLFHYSLAHGGVLFLGSAEAIGGAARDLFAPLDARARIYRRIDMPSQTVNLALPERFRSLPGHPVETKAGAQPANLQCVADQIVLRQFAPTVVLVSDRGDIVYINGSTGRYLEPAAGKVGWNIHTMAREGLRAGIGSALHQVLRKRGRIELNDLSVSDDGKTHRVSLVVQMMEEPEALRDKVMVVLAELPPLPDTRSDRRRAPRGRRQVEIEYDLQQARDEIRTLRKEMQASQEALKSANEELQSTNEELTTLAEEMQSLNDELQTVNVELQFRIDDLSCANNDMQNLFDSTEIAGVLLDNLLNIRRFTPFASRVIQLIATDVGRPLFDLTTELDYPALEDDAREVLHTLVSSEKQIAARNDRWFSVRIMAYRTLDNMIAGVVITFIDISAAK